MARLENPSYSVHGVDKILDLCSEAIAKIGNLVSDDTVDYGGSVISRISILRGCHQWEC
ncbi:hypothetical protein [Limnospira platensis]|uniref:hypothetical protein n=1 Tax=Limnospira platensis TaxID=118562 RepID=UPI0002F75D5A|nr:hypothetical protein AP9108_01520 [Arthrospira sp. PCC 9108]